MVTYTKHLLFYSNDDGKDDDPCDDWSEHPMPKPQKDNKNG